jgi:hypothetical protein
MLVHPSKKLYAPQTNIFWKDEQKMKLGFYGLLTPLKVLRKSAFHLFLLFILPKSSFGQRKVAQARWMVASKIT